MACVKRFMNEGYQQTMTVLFHSFHLESIHTADLPGDIDIVCFYHQVKSGLDASTIYHLVHSGLVHAFCAVIRISVGVSSLTGSHD